MIIAKKANSTESKQAELSENVKMECRMQKMENEEEFYEA